MKLTIRPAARRDILNQYGHYLTIDLPYIAERFLASVEDSVDALMGAPKAGSPRHFANPLQAREAGRSRALTSAATTISNAPMKSQLCESCTVGATSAPS